MTNEQAVFEVLAGESNVGTTLNSAWRNVSYRIKDKQAKKRTLEILRALERDEDRVRGARDRHSTCLAPCSALRASAAPILGLVGDVDRVAVDPDEILSGKVGIGRQEGLQVAGHHAHLGAVGAWLGYRVL